MYFGIISGRFWHEGSETKAKGKPRKKRLASMEHKTSFNMAVSVHAKNQLKRLASFFGMTQRAMIETILEKSEQEALRQIKARYYSPDKYYGLSESGAGQIENFFPDHYEYERHKVYKDFTPDCSLLEKIKALVNKAVPLHHSRHGYRRKGVPSCTRRHISFVYDPDYQGKPTCYLFDMFREHNGGSVRRIVLGTIEDRYDDEYRIYGLMGGMEQRVCSQSPMP
jgi:hypothetical protein